jgi:hypothetical protein
MTLFPVPKADVTLSWATFFDAADEAGVVCPTIEEVQRGPKEE